MARATLRQAQCSSDLFRFHRKFLGPFRTCRQGRARPRSADALEGTEIVAKSGCEEEAAEIHHRGPSSQELKLAIMAEAVAETSGTAEIDGIYNHARPLGRIEGAVEVW